MKTNFINKISKNFNDNKLSTEMKLKNFPRFVDRRDVAKFLNRYEIFKKQLNIHGSVVECGVNLGAGVFSWLHFSSILEPYNSSRHIYGFDTFDGFKSLDNKKDSGGVYLNQNFQKKFSNTLKKDNILESTKIHNQNRPLNHLSKVSMIKGDMTKTFPHFLKKNPHLIISLLHIDLDIYEPTKIVLELMKPRLVKGCVIAFDDLNAKEGPGETLALLETFGLNKYKLVRNEFDSYLSYLIID